MRVAALQSAVVTSVVLFFGALLWLGLERRRTLAEANLAELVDSFLQYDFFSGTARDFFATVEPLIAAAAG